jgi:hypothetical protein
LCEIAQPQLLELNLFGCSFADMSCFQGLLLCPEAASLIFHNFCIYHIDAPGHEVTQHFERNRNRGEKKERKNCKLNRKIVLFLFGGLILTNLHFVLYMMQLGAAAIPPCEPTLSTEDLADQVGEVLDHFG